MTFKLRLLGLFALLIAPLLFSEQLQPRSGALRGSVQDPSGAQVPAARIVLTLGGHTFETKSGADGRYQFLVLAPGTYSLIVTARDFAPLTMQRVQIAPGQTVELNLPLAIAVQQQQLTVTGEPQGVGVAPDQNSGTTILRGSALNAFSDDPDELQSELQALAGPSAGPNGGQIYIDGFAGGKLPPKSSILEIRINQNPFSAEFDRIGYGRIEIITKPGSEKFQGSIASYGNVSALNTANPLVPSQPSYYQYSIVGNLSGPLSKNASAFLSAYHMTRQNQVVVDALDPENTSASITEAFPTPIEYWLVNPRVDFQLGRANTVTIRDLFYRTSQTGVGVGTLNLASQASSVVSQENALQLGDTILVNAHFVNETHFQWSHIVNNQTPASLAPTVIVEGAFTSGGSSAGMERDTQDNLELQNYSTATAGNHTLRFGARLRSYDDRSDSTAGANGSYFFNSVAAYLAETLTQYTQTVIANPLAKVVLFDAALFVQDDWRWRPSFDVGLGLRFEGQNRIRDHADWAPRIALAWSPDHSLATPPKTILRAGYGWFYNRFTVPNFFSADSGTPYILEAIHDNGINQQSYVVDNPASSAASSIPSYHSIDPHFHAALDMQAGVGVDRQLGKGITANVTYLYTRGVHQYETNNVTAPAFNPSTYSITGPAPGVYNYQFQSGGVYRQNQLIVTTNVQRKQFVLSGTYLLNQAKSDTQGVTSTPSVAANPGLDYGRPSFGFRQRVVVLSSYNAPWRIVFASSLVAQSGTPYNLTIGDDLTGNNQFNARPTFGTCEAADVVATRYGCLDTAPAGKGETIVPYGLGTGPANALYYVRLSKVIGIGPRTRTAGQGSDFHSGDSVTGRGLSGSSAAIHLDAAAPRKYSLTFVASSSNVFNMVNRGTPNGVLLSPLFNKYQSLATGAFSNPTPGNRAITFQTSFNF